MKKRRFDRGGDVEIDPLEEANKRENLDTVAGPKAEPYEEPPRKKPVAKTVTKPSPAQKAAAAPAPARTPARASAPSPAPSPAPAPARTPEDQYSGRARLKQMLGTAESRAGVKPDIKAEDIAAAKAAGEAKRAKYREDLFAPIKRLAARAGTQEMREKYKAEGYAKGGKVRGDGICQRGHTKGKMR